MRGLEQIRHENYQAELRDRAVRAERRLEDLEALTLTQGRTIDKLLSAARTEAHSPGTVDWVSLLREHEESDL